MAQQDMLFQPAQSGRGNGSAPAFKRCLLDGPPYPLH